MRDTLEGLRFSPGPGIKWHSSHKVSFRTGPRFSITSARRIK
jgi:hypothetical protein